MPWKGERDPYKIWLSEIILQQTRVQQGLSYYNKFVSHYPHISDLARAPDEEVFKLWEGLGYYSRCKNILATARHITQEFSGIFPHNYDDILGLKGVGSYTAAAISSFAYDLPYAVIDGNVLRVLSRFFGISTPIDSTVGRKKFNELAAELLHTKQPAAYNQAIMDFGATICKPQIPLCNECVLVDKCTAYITNQVNTLPVKEKKLIRKTRFFSYFLLCAGNEVIVNRRLDKDIWQNLYEFTILETESLKKWSMETADHWLREKMALDKFSVGHISPIYKQQLTHQTIVSQFIKVRFSTFPDELKSARKMRLEHILELAFPKTIKQYLETDFQDGHRH